MKERFLTILEVSQKQAYIFSSNKLKKNITNSATIAKVTSADWINDVVGDCSIFSKDRNLVYAGGGHTVLEFADKTDADNVVYIVTAKVLELLPSMELFAKTIRYDEHKTPGENIADLTAALERKKSLRKASFHQLTFGVESAAMDDNDVFLSGNDTIAPAGYEYTSEISNLGGDESNFIAVVHIDGNAMGKRVEEISHTFSKDWIEYKTKMRQFSESITKDFNDAYRKMEEIVVEAMKTPVFFENLSLKNATEQTFYFPVRKIIAEGDDICFVANGQIGIECAVAFLNILSEKENAVDGKKYAACAGVTLVHQKYPFYRAYELAEELCSNAKRLGSSIGSTADSKKYNNGEDISCIDWHIEYGEMHDSLEETRKQYKTADGKLLEMKPYLVKAPKEVLDKEACERQYAYFREMLMQILKKEDDIGRGLWKELRSVLKEGEKMTDYYLRFHKVQGLSKTDGRYFIKTHDGKERSILFDGIEMMDNMILMEERNNEG